MVSILSAIGILFCIETNRSAGLLALRVSESARVLADLESIDLGWSAQSMFSCSGDSLLDDENGVLLLSADIEIDWAL